MRNIFLFARDPGGANTIIPLVEPLKSKGYKVKLYGKDVALQKFKKNNLSFIDINSTVSSINLENITDFIKKESPDFIITATSADDFTEKFIWKAAESLKIPTFAILDQWVNYGIRFSEFSVSELKEYERERKHLFLPMYILVMDEYAKKEMVKLGFEETRILISGQPHFDMLINKKDYINKNEINKFRESISCNSSDFLITFASEPITKIYRETDDSEHYWGYTERTILKELVDSLEKIVPMQDKEVKFIIKLHPKEGFDNFSNLLSEFESKGIKFIVDTDTEPYLLIMSSNLICGMSSMFLFEATLMGKPVVSIQIGLNRENPFILDQRGIIKSITDKSALTETLRILIPDGNLPIIDYGVHNGAVKKVIEYMEELLCRN
jgi:hypothetical protein